MPDYHIMSPKAFGIVLLAVAGQEVTALVQQLPEILLQVARQKAAEEFTSGRLLNYGIQYTALALTLDPPGHLNLCVPANLASQGMQSIANSSTPQEAASKLTIAAATLILGSVSANDPSTSVAYGTFLAALIQNVFLAGLQCVLPVNFCQVYVIRTLLTKIYVEIQVERRRKKLGLPRAKFKFFETEKKQNFVYKVLRFKKRKVKVLSRDITLPIVYEKECVIKQTPMVQAIPYPINNEPITI